MELGGSCPWARYVHANLGQLQRHGSQEACAAFAWKLLVQSKQCSLCNTIWIVLHRQSIDKKSELDGNLWEMINSWVMWCIFEMCIVIRAQQWSRQP
eukprot:jgi/Botrbrau1/9739/Bobra.0388s0028.1